jgi:hypothetical protein
VIFVVGFPVEVTPGVEVTLAGDGAGEGAAGMYGNKFYFFGDREEDGLADGLGAVETKLVFGI